MWPFRSKTKAEPPATSFDAASTDGRLVYAVGDVHGRLDLLRLLVSRIANDLAASAPTSGAPVLLFVGDYVDRGEQSRGVIDMVIALLERSGFDVRCLKGNHEETLLNFLDDPATGPAWGLFGGRATLKSYGVNPPLGVNLVEWEAARDAFAEAMPQRHLEFYRSLSTRICIGDYLFVHAGVRHGVELEAQSERDMLWIRDAFLEETRPFEKFVVHGHSPTNEPYFGPHRICVDTGAYATGVLTAARLLDADRSFISTDQTAPAPSQQAWTRLLTWAAQTSVEQV
jgi:serine/threonine protein phosphatase 1